MKVEIKDLHKQFGEVEVLHGISFCVESGKALGLLGRNGAGKTTIIRIIMDMFKPNSGQVLLDGQSAWRQKVHIGYLPEERGLYPKKKVNEQIVYLACLKGMKVADAKREMCYWLSRLNVSEYANRKLSTLSKGNQQKVQLAQTLVGQPDVILLDEPFSGLDPCNSEILKNIISELIAQGKLVIFSSHQMNYVEEFCEDIVIVNQGQIVLYGNLKKIKKDFGRDRLVLSLKDRDGEETVKILQEQFRELMIVLEEQKEQTILQLKPDICKKQLISALVEADLDIESFGNYEPSLNDIFLENVGV